MFHFVKKFIFPSRCVICDEVLPFGDRLENNFLCKSCRDKIEFINGPTCKKCGAMIYGDDDAYCIRCKNDMHKSFEYGFGLCRYNEEIKESLHRIKYNGRKEYIEFFGKCIAKTYHEKIKNINPEYLVPVPIHRDRKRERGYNQASVLAYAISDELLKYGVEIPVNEDLIYRTKNTKVLNKLDNDARSRELNDAFKTNSCEGINSVMIVDDIYTTGSTMEKIAKALKDSGVKKVYFTAIAIVDNL